MSPTVPPIDVFEAINTTRAVRRFTTEQLTHWNRFGTQRDRETA